MLPLYRAPNMRFECHVVYTNTPVAGAFRGYGCPQGFFAQETVVDEIAYELGIDPVEFRKKNVIRLGDIDELSAQLGEGKQGPAAAHSKLRLAGVPGARRRGHRLGATKTSRALPETTPTSHLQRGVGVACTMQGSGIAGVDWAVGVAEDERGRLLQSAGGRVRCGGGSGHGAGANRRGNAGRHAGQDDCHAPAIPTSRPFDVGAYASSTTIISGGAVKKACGEGARPPVAPRVQDARRPGR